VATIPLGWWVSINALELRRQQAMGDIGLVNVIDGLIYGMTVIAILAMLLTIGSS